MMQSKRKATIRRIVLLVGLTLLLSSALVLYSGGGAKILAAVYTWTCSVNDACGEFENNSTGGLADGVYGITDGDWGICGDSSGDTGEGVRAYASGDTGRGLWATSLYYHGVYGEGGSGSGDYGGWFEGYNGINAEGTGTSGYGLYAYSAEYYGARAEGADFGVYGRASDEDGQGVRGYTSGADGYGVYGRDPNNIGVRGEGDNVDGYGGYFTGYDAVRGDTSGFDGYAVFGKAKGEQGRGVFGVATGERGRGVVGKATGSAAYAGYFYSENYRGLYADGTGFLDAYFPDKIRVGSTTITNFGIALNALNSGSEALEPGDLVAFDGVIASGADVSRPTLAVKKISAANSFAVIGVVQAAYVEEKASPEVERSMAPVPPPPPAEADQQEYYPVPQEEPKLGQQPTRPRTQVHEPLEEEPQPPLPKTAAPLTMEGTESLPGPDGRFIEGPAAPGQYVVVVIQGITQVKVDARATPVRAGDTLAASASGRAINVSLALSRSRGGAAEPGNQGSRRSPSQVLTIGRALEPLDTGTGSIYVFVSVQ